MAEKTIQWDKDADGIVTLTMDDPTGSANVMNEHYKESMHYAVQSLLAEKDSITGVVITSAKKTFFAGGDLKGMMKIGPDDAGEAFAMVEDIKADLRALETLGKPVVAAINGAALGGGLEIALACHHRIAADVRGSQIGLPEVTLGLLPGGGGVARTVRMFGIQKAFMEVLSQGTRFTPAKAQATGLVDELVDTVEELVPAAKAWIKANPEGGVQPWDVKGYKMPGGTPSSPGLAGILPSFPALLKKQLKGAPMPAPRAILDAAVEGAQVDFDTASRHRPDRQEHDPGVLPGPAGHQRWRLASRGHRQAGDQEDRCAGRGHDGRRYRLRVGQGGLRGRPQGRHAGSR